MSIFKREESAEAARTRVERLESQRAQATAEMESARAALGAAVAGEDDAAASAARTRLTRARERCEELDAALPIARRALSAAEDRRAADERERLQKAARRANQATVKAAAEFDAALRSLAAAYEAVQRARAAEGTARRAAGMQTRTTPLGYEEVAALFHASPKLGAALRARLLQRLPPTNRHFRPLAEQVRRAGTETDETEAPAAASA